MHGLEERRQEKGIEERSINNLARILHLPHILV
jgi:hypothetical protein